MADIPTAVTIAAKDYIDQIEFMEEWGEDWKASKWNREDEERRELHDRFLDTLRKVGITWRSMDDSQRIAIAITKRRWRARKSMNTKARRPAQTMADIPASTRIAANNYVEYVDYMQGRRLVRDSREWQRMDNRRHALHNRYLGELRKIGLRWGLGDDSEQIARNIIKRRWRARKSAGRDRLVDRIVARLALKLVGWKSASLVLTFRNVEPFESLRRHIRDLEWAGARVTGSRMLRGRLDIGEIRVLVSDVAAFIRRFKRTRTSDYWRERWGT